MDLDSDTGMALSSADRALGRLAGAGRNLLNPHLLIPPYVAREALTSSRIEGTQASLSDVFDFELHRSQYYDRFQAVRERGELKEWLVFFLTGVSEIAVDAVPRSERLTDLREIFRSRLVGDRSQAVAVVDAVLENPVLTTRRVASEQDMTIQGARNVIGRLEEKGIVREAGGTRSAGCVPMSGRFFNPTLNRNSSTTPTGATTRATSADRSRETHVSDSAPGADTPCRSAPDADTRVVGAA